MEKSSLKEIIVSCSFCFNTIALAETNKHGVSKRKSDKIREKFVAIDPLSSREAGKTKDQYQ